MIMFESWHNHDNNVDCKKPDGMLISLAERWARKKNWKKGITSKKEDKVQWVKEERNKGISDIKTYMNILSSKV